MGILDGTDIGTQEAGEEEKLCRMLIDNVLYVVLGSITGSDWLGGNGFVRIHTLGCCLSAAVL